MKQQQAAPPLRDMTVGHFTLQKAYICLREEGTHDWQLLFHHEGLGMIYHQDGDLEVCEGDCYLLKPRVKHNYGLPDDGGLWKSYWAHFIPRANWLSLLQWEEVREGLLYKKISDSDTLTGMIDLFKQCLEFAQSERRLSNHLAMNRLEEILIRIAMQDEEESFSGLDERMLTVVKHIHGNFNRDLPLYVLAKRAELSEASFCRLFKKEVGKSPANYVEHIRIKNACAFLTDTGYSVKDISFMVGFSSESYFCARFKKYNGLSPIEYRKHALPLDNSLEI